MNLTWNQLFRVFGFAWLYRKPINALLLDYERLSYLGGRLSLVADAEAAQVLVRDILNLACVNEIVKTTPTEWDDKQLERLKALAADTVIFQAAWKILNNDWKINIQKNRLQIFLQKVRKILPFASPNLEMLDIAEASPAELGVIGIKDEEAEMGVIEILSLITLLVQVLPRIIEIFKK